MPLENMTDMLAKALAGKYAVGAFNILDYNSTKAVVRAAEEMDSPVIIQTSAKTVVFWGTSAIIGWVRELAESSPVPIALHLDHCKDLELIRQCVETGWTSVMIDTSARPFEENLALSRQVVEMARPRGITVEAELGAIVGVEDDIHVKEQDAHLADPEQVVKFCAEVKPDCFAPAVGTAHGVYKGEPRIAYDRIKEISARTGIPLALHGGTGLSDEVFRKCISLGCAKVNISTRLKYAFIDGFVAYHTKNNTEYNPLKVIEAQFEELKRGIIDKIKLFGGSRCQKEGYVPAAIEAKGGPRGTQISSAPPRQAGLKAVIFDCDGVLADTERDGHRVAFNRAFVEKGLDIAWDVELYGELLKIAGGKERMRHYFDTSGWPAEVDDRDTFIKELHRLKTDFYMKIIESGELPLRPGVARLVDEAFAEKIALAVCSTSNERAVNLVVERLLGPKRKSHFAAVLAGDVVSKKKPDPEIYNLARQQLHLDCGQCIVIEDSRNGLLAAKAAGMYCVVTTNGYTEDEDFAQADLVVPELGDPPNVKVTIKILKDIVEER